MSIATGAFSLTAGHLALFYGRDEQLASGAGRFCEAGLAAGDAVLVVATAAHRRAIRAEIVAGRRGLARVAELEAASTLERITGDDGCVERELFFDVMVPALSTLALAADTGRVRIFGEMVALLTDAGDPDGAIALEELWNELGQGPVPFPLLCGYPRSHAVDDDCGPWVERVGEVHTALLDESAL